ncbi:DNA alkylation response protein [Comamonas serinivorans]|uniref:DNA alkylation response protein n=1 Tax=Comamonas serinivorans TaxID=1082851 RepID=A0A1Y0ESR7_9BURK|nr:acyl-CoA dehydrogenase family protein [Comamonas serinivorans]ARU06653.1 DNA alkylation response protein [Comamonas serinivorans]
MTPTPIASPPQADLPAANANDPFANVVDEATRLNPFAGDAALREAVQRQDADWAQAQLHTQGEGLGQPEIWALAELANRHTPELQRFDARGRAIDRVEFHPAWHALMAQYRAQGLIGLPFDGSRPGRWSAWAAGFMLHGQIEQGTLCPATMTTAAIPVLQHEPELWQSLQPKLMSPVYDPQDAPIAHKRSIWIGMGMTEKQGGSDVRANTTLATPLGAEGRGQPYALTGHKWFYSAPMCDAHLVVARTHEAGGWACFFVPRWRFDGTRNAVHIERLKDKVGNQSNASAEVRFDGAWGLLLGEPGRGIPTIIEMATHTRLNCVLGATAIMRQALVQALYFARRRQAFGKTLIEQPLMRSVLTDLALESEAATVLAMHLAQAYEHVGSDPLARSWQRVLTPAAKFWLCKRSVAFTGECMEVLGGNGYVDTGIVARLFREAPVNSIWEGSGNVMCLDVLRAVGRDPEAAFLLLQDLQDAAAGDAALLEVAGRVERHWRALADDPQAGEREARWVTTQLVLLAQAGLLRRHSPAAVADAFIATRLCTPHSGSVFGQWANDRVDAAAQQAVLTRALIEA